MIKHFKFIALVLALLMILACFASCVQLEDDFEIEGPGGGDQAEKVPESVEKKDYGSQFFLSVLTDVNPLKYYWVEKSEGDAMSEAIYARQEKVYNYLGVEIVATSAGRYDTYVDPFRDAVLKRDGSVDCLISHVQTGVGGFVKDMYLRDFNELPGVDLDQDYWNEDFMNMLAIDGSYYLGFSNFNILYTNVIAFNKDMLDQYAGSMEKTLYQMVEDYEWTLDEMLALAQLVSTDKTGDGKTEDDIYGLTGQQWVPWVNFLHASNINLIEMNEKGKYEISFMNSVNAERTNILVNKLKAFSSSENAYLEFPLNGTGAIQKTKVPLTTGRALMQLTSTFDLEGFLKFDINFGVVPYPMFDTNQKNVGYRSLQWGGYLCVPSYVDNETKVGETLEVLAFYSDDVMVTFYEKMLGKQVADVPEDAKMLDEYIWDTVTSDFGQTYADYKCLYFLPTVTRDTADGGQEMMSYYNSFDKATNKSIDDFVKQVTINKAKLGK